MIRRWVKGRVAVFIDSGNFYFYEKNLGWQIEFGKLMAYLKNETRLWKVFFYIAFDPENEKQKKFIEFLKTRGFFVRAKEIKYIKYKPEQEAVKAGFHKGNIDVELVIDAIQNKTRYDTFVLFSGDSDFAPLITYLKNGGKKCFVFSVKTNVSKELLSAGNFFDIARLKRYIKK